MATGHTSVHSFAFDCFQQGLSDLHICGHPHSWSFKQICHAIWNTVLNRRIMKSWRNCTFQLNYVAMLIFSLFDPFCMFPLRIESSSSVRKHAKHSYANSAWSAHPPEGSSGLRALQHQHQLSWRRTSDRTMVAACSTYHSVGSYIADQGPTNRVQFCKIQLKFTRKWDTESRKLKCTSADHAEWLSTPIFAIKIKKPLEGPWPSTISYSQDVSDFKCDWRLPKTSIAGR